MRGWNKGGMNSARDFGWMIKKLEHVLPKKRDNKADVPFHNGPLRWPELNGGPFYDDRQIKITFQHEGAHHEGHADDPSYFINWLMAHSDEPMSDDWDFGWLYYGECFDVTWNQEMTISTVEAVFTCEPMKQRRWLTDAIPDEFYDERIDTRTETVHLTYEWSRLVIHNKGPAAIPLDEYSFSGRSGWYLVISDDPDYTPSTPPGLWDDPDNILYTMTANGTMSSVLYRFPRLQPGVNYVWAYSISASADVNLRFREVSL